LEANNKGGLRKLMSQFLVAVIDGTRARFFTLEQAEVPEYESGPNLIERGDMVNPAKELAGKELWANVKTGRNRGAGNQAHGYDDRRDSHLGEFGRRFAGAIAEEIAQLKNGHQVSRLVLVAEPQILGFVRDAINAHSVNGVQIDELAKDLSKLKPLDLHEYLASKALLPARKTVSS
jgi:protein required for attachment to host cells